MVIADDTVAGFVLILKDKLTYFLIFHVPIFQTMCETANLLFVRLLVF